MKLADGFMCETDIKLWNRPEFGQEKKMKLTARGKKKNETSFIIQKQPKNSCFYGKKK